MLDKNKETHKQALPSARTIRRACNRELYRTIKRLKIWISPEDIQLAEKVYYEKVISNLLWVAQNGSNRKLLADWWELNVAPEIAPIWNVEPAILSAAFRESFGG